MSDSLFEAPFYFIGEYLNGWVILILIIIIIYFVALRNYYLKKEKFYDQSMQLKEMNEIEDNEDQINNDYNGLSELVNVELYYSNDCYNWNYIGNINSHKYYE